jgi:hypothetical protein
MVATARNDYFSLWHLKGSVTTRLLVATVQERDIAPCPTARSPTHSTTHAAAPQPILTIACRPHSVAPLGNAVETKTAWPSDFPRRPAKRLRQRAGLGRGFPAGFSAERTVGPFGGVKRKGVSLLRRAAVSAAAAPKRARRQTLKRNPAQTRQRDRPSDPYRGETLKRSPTRARLSRFCQRRQPRTPIRAERTTACRRFRDLARDPLFQRRSELVRR